jgi:site-specific DNA recombinase
MEKNDATSVYVRVSTIKESQRDSPEHQKGLCEEKARMLGLEVLHTYEDRDSGTSIVGRKEIQKLVADAKKGYFSTIIFASLSRFSRDTLDSLNLKRILVDMLGLRLVSIEEGFDSAKDNDELKFQIISAVNQKLSEQISLSSKRGIRQSALKGNFTGGITPYGYKKAKEGDRKTLVLDENTEPNVKLIFDLYTAHKMGEKAIVKYLNQEKKIASPKGGLWGLSSIQRILTNEVYTGENVFCKYEVKKVYNDINNLADRSNKQVQQDKSKWERTGTKTHEAIIDDDLFKLAQEIRLKRGGGKRGGVRNKVNVFAGMIFCKHCNASMISCKSKARKDGQEYRYLICSSRRRQGESGCDNKLWIPYFDFRDSIIQEISAKLKKAMNAEEISSDYKSKIVRVNGVNSDKEQKRLEKLINSHRKLLFELRKQKMLGEIEDDQYRFEKAEYEKQITTYQSELKKMNENIEGQININKIHEEISTALRDLAELKFEHVDEMRLVLMKLIDKLVVSMDGEVEVYTPLGHI